MNTDAMQTPLNRATLILLLVASWMAGALHADDTEELKAAFRKANGKVLRLDAGRQYEISEKIELSTLCPRGIKLDGRGATLRALPGFRQSVLLTATVLLRDAPYSPGVYIRNLNIDGDGNVSRCVFGNWKNARIDQLTVRGGTVYQVNAIWNDSLLTNIRIDGNATQTNNGFDCNLQHSTVYNMAVDMHGNLDECAFWLNGCKDAKVINLRLTDGRTAFGLENCKGVDVVNLTVRGDFSFRVANILPADPSERIHLYNVDFASRHVGKDASTGVHFNATRGGLVAGGSINTPGPGVLLTHQACDIAVVNVALPRQPVYPANGWRSTPEGWRSLDRQQAASNCPPVVFAGIDRAVRLNKDKSVELSGIVADELPVDRLQIRWSQKGGPGPIRFAHADRPQTTAFFPKSGIYKLVLTASDGELETSEEVTLKVVDVGRVTSKATGVNR